jgi:hypothetical protein
MTNSSSNANYGGKISNRTSYIKDFANSINYPIRNAYLPIFVKATTPYSPLGTFIKSFNNYDKIIRLSSLSSSP